MKEKLMVIGASGLVGQEMVATSVRDGYQCIAAARSDLSSLNEVAKTTHLDVCSLQETRVVLQSERPDIIVHAGGLIGVGKCQKDPDRARQVNVAGTINLIDAALSYKPLVILVSTDAVFDGKRGSYRENDGTNPANTYGVTKRGGELMLEASTLPWLVVRTSVVYGRYRYMQGERRFIDDVLSHLREQKSFEVMQDTVNSPTYLTDVCRGITHLINREAKGVFHVAGPQASSKYEFAQQIAREYNLDSGVLLPVFASSVESLKSYSGNTSLDVSKLVASGYNPVDIPMGLNLYRSSE